MKMSEQISKAIKSLKNSNRRSATYIQPTSTNKPIDVEGGSFTEWKRRTLGFVDDPNYSINKRNAASDKEFKFVDPCNSVKNEDKEDFFRSIRNIS